MQVTKFYENFDLFYAHKQRDTGPIILLLAEQSADEITKFQTSGLDVWGAVFPEVIFENQHYKKGIVVLSLNGSSSQVSIIEDMADPCFDDLSNSAHSFFVFVDGLSKHIDSFLEELFIHTHDGVKIMGGGAGKLTLTQDKIIFDKQRCYQDAALVFSLDRKMGIGVNHGWQKIQGPFVATSTDGNYLKQIDYQDAVTFYKKKVLECEGIELTQENFFDVAKKYPLGIETYANETVVRDPINFNTQGLLLVGRIEENSVISLLSGYKDFLIAAAREASHLAQQNLHSDVETFFVVDCISRVLFLEENFHEELFAIKDTKDTATLFGVLTLGEIANSSNRYIEFFNKTCVVGVL